MRIRDRVSVGSGVVLAGGPCGHHLGRRGRTQYELEDAGQLEPRRRAGQRDPWIAFSRVIQRVTMVCDHRHLLWFRGRGT